MNIVPSLDTTVMILERHGGAPHPSNQPSTKWVRLGECVGQGAFSEVFHVTEWPRPEDEDDNEDGWGGTTTTVSVVAKKDQLLLECQPFLAHGGDISTERMVVKRLKNKIRGDKETFRVAFADLRQEANILASLPRHENIVRLVGIPANWDVSALQERSTTASNCFLLLEQVDTTLDKCLENIQSPIGTGANALGRQRFLFRRNRRHCTIMATQRQRITEFALPIAKALHFLHKHDIVYRDIKPANIGVSYDPRTGASTVKLLDFGLARPCAGWTHGVPGKYSAGTPRYMSPEQMSRNNHGLASDVHSFGIVLWQICTLCTPFANGVTSKFLKQLIVTQESRPRLHHIQSIIVQDLLTKCWSTNPWLRPHFHEILLTLQDYTTE